MKPIHIRRLAGLSLACFFGTLLVTSPARAGDALIEGGRLCTEQFPVQERAQNIPTHLLAAISTTESGRWHDGLGMAVPWPWTINVEGKGYYYKTKAEAIANTQNFLAQGHQSIDVGCMQVNLKHHSKAFANLNEAFDPKTNVAYAAKFLHDNYAELGDWIKATAAYHSRTQVYGQQYLVQIERSWNKIVAKVAAARATQNATTQSALAQPAPDAHASITQAQREISETRRSIAKTAPASRSLPDAHNVQIVKVSDGLSPKAKADQVLVIRGTPTPSVTPAAAPLPSDAPVKVANADDALVVRPGGDSVRRVALDNGSAAAQPKEAPSGPKFVFAN